MKTAREVLQSKSATSRAHRVWAASSTCRLAYAQGFSMGYAHARELGADYLYSDSRIPGMEQARDAAAANCGPFATKPNGAFHGGYENGFEAALESLGGDP